MEFNKRFTSIDTHTGGEPLRIITGGLPRLKGTTILEKRAYFKEFHDDLRRILMFEPRGHHGMYGCVVTDPISENADFGVLFMHNEGFSTMCGHGIIGVVTALVETGQLTITDSNQTILIDSPAGLVKAHADVQGTEVNSVSFENVPSFVYKADVPIKLPGGLEFTVDIAFGGAFYAFVDATVLGVRVQKEQIAKLQELELQIKQYIETNYEIAHPLERELKGIYGVIFSDKPEKPNSHLRNVTVFADEQIDRSPCGTGTSARLAVLYHRGQIQLNENFVHESIVGSQFTGKVLHETKVDSFDAVVPEITGDAFITGFHQFVIDPSDPLAKGFLLR